MENKLKQYEEELLQRVEERLEQGEYEEEYIMSKKSLEEKFERTMGKAERNIKRSYFRMAGKAVAACVAAALLLTVSIPGMRTAAADFLHSTLGLTVSGTDADKKTENAKKDAGFSYEWIMKMTEQEYWEWLQAHELTGKEMPSYVPEGYQENRENAPLPYTYTFEEVKDVPWSEKTIDPWNRDTYGHLATEQTDSLLSAAEKKEASMEGAVLSGMSRQWKNGRKELFYKKEIYDFFEVGSQAKKRGNAAETLSVHGDEAYLVPENDGTWLYIFGDDTITMLNANEAFSQKEAKEILVKMAESVQ